MDTVGPMTRTVRDCAMMFNAIAGHDPRDAAQRRGPGPRLHRRPDARRQGPADRRRPGYFFHHLQPPVDAAVHGALKTLEGLGAQIVDVEIDHIHGNISAQLTVESAEPSTYHQRWLRERPEDYGEDVRVLLEIGELHLATHYIQAQRYRSLLRASSWTRSRPSTCSSAPRCRSPRRAWGR